MEELNNLDKEPEVKLPVDLQDFLKDNLSFFKFVGNTVDLYITGCLKIGPKMLSPESQSGLSKNKENQEDITDK